MLRLTVFFFGGCITVMFTLVCVASAIFAETTVLQLVAMVLALVGLFATLRCGQGAWDLLRHPDTAVTPMDPRLDA